ncbi:hypothetical protein E2C01_027040 [Portunus trituberculatus]|uniref:Uncharacterized protein n=1 Tax=Portunus trituberculatus TaxID=210409 RepID=A0A5B7EKW5_PORTR|nr:hypothetical protein [Portunus trituberculatus]
MEHLWCSVGDLVSAATPLPSLYRHQACSRHSTYISNYKGTRLAGAVTPTQLPVKTHPNRDALCASSAGVVSVGFHDRIQFGKQSLSVNSMSPTS